MEMLLKEDQKIEKLELMNQKKLQWKMKFQKGQLETMLKKLRSMNLDPVVLMDIELEYENEVWMLNMLNEDSLNNEDDIMEYECTSSGAEMCPPPARETQSVHREVWGLSKYYGRNKCVLNTPTTHQQLPNYQVNLKD